MSKTTIEWAAHQRADGTLEPGHTWNPVTGCTRASAGCDNCYAVRVTQRIAGYGNEKYKGLVNPGKSHFNGVVKCHTAELARPLRKTKPTTWFVNSMSDLFHDAVPFDFIDQVFAVMAMCAEHKFLILTKRADRMAEYFAAGEGALMDRWATAACEPATGNSSCAAGVVGEAAWPLANVGLGVSIEDQASADLRVMPLLHTPAAMRFISAEPLLGPVDLTRLPTTYDGHPTHFDALVGQWHSIGGFWPGYISERISWVIVGGESGTGPGIRPMHQDWASNIREQCRVAEVAFFFKQWGRWWPITQLPEGVHDSLYVPKRPSAVAEMGEERARDVYGERCTVPSCSIDQQGQPYPMGRVNPDKPDDWNPGPPLLLFDVGKKRSGRLLYGREHNDRPESFFSPSQTS